MKKPKILQKVLPGLIFVFLIGSSCNQHHSWTEKERKDFECNCAKTATFNNLSLVFSGFESNEFDSVLVKEYNNMILLDSFKFFVFPSQDPLEKENKTRSGTISRTMNVKYTYQFIIPGQKPYELANMKMVVWSQWTMNSEGYGCVMGDFSLDGVKFEHVGNPEIKKR